MQEQISHGRRHRPFWVIVQHQPDRSRGRHRGQEDGQIFGPDIHRLGLHHCWCWSSDDTARRQQFWQGCRLPACHRWWNRYRLCCQPLPNPGIHPSHPDCPCHGPLRVLTQLWIREFSSHPFPYLSANNLSHLDLGCHRWRCHHPE